MVRPMAVPRKNPSEDPQAKKNITSPSLFQCTSKKNLQNPKSKTKTKKNDLSFQRLAGPTPPKKNVWKMILSLFNSSTFQTSPPHFFQGPHRNALGTGTTLLRMRTRPKQTLFLFLSSKTEKYQIHKEVFKKKEQINKKHEER